MTPRCFRAATRSAAEILAVAPTTSVGPTLRTWTSWQKQFQTNVYALGQALLALSYMRCNLLGEAVPFLSSRAQESALLCAYQLTMCSAAPKCICQLHFGKAKGRLGNFTSDLD